MGGEGGSKSTYIIYGMQKLRMRGTLPPIRLRHHDMIIKHRDKFIWFDAVTAVTEGWYLLECNAM
jgi:hypothetical protein